MRQNSVKKNLIISLCLLVALICAGCAVFFSAGFATDFQTAGGWVLSAQITPDFAVSDAAGVIGSARELIPGSDVSLDDSQQTLTEVLTVLSDRPIGMDETAFITAMNEKHPGLLAEDATRIYHLESSSTAFDSLILAGSFAFLSAVIFAALWLLSGIGAASAVLLGLAVNCAAFTAAILLTRIPAGRAFAASLALCFALTVFMNLRALGAAKPPAANRRDPDSEKSVKFLFQPLLQNAGGAALAIASIAAVFAVTGVLFGAGASWFHYSGSILLAGLTPLVFANFVIPGLFSGNR